VLALPAGVCPPGLLGRMNASIRFLVFGALPLDGLLGGVTGERLGVHCGQAKEAGGAAQPGRSWLLDCLVCWVQAAWVVRRMEGELP
jgi:hypothetical protein